MQQQTIIVAPSPMLSLRGLDYHILHHCNTTGWKNQKPNHGNVQVLIPIYWTETNI
jgi:hypothetical protein